MKVWCEKHGMGLQDERWKVHLEELEDDSGVHFKGQVCPECYTELQQICRKLKRNLKIQCRDVIKLRTENNRLQSLVDVTTETLHHLSGQDPNELVKRQYRANKFGGGIQQEDGDLMRIIPNMIAKLAKGRKKQ
jgi:hypothetical protein